MFNAPTSTDFASIGIAILLGYSVAISLRCGLLSVAPAAFAGIAAYAFGLLTVHHVASPLVAAVVTVVGSAVLGAVVAFPLRRIRGVYTSIATLAILVIATGLESSFTFTGGTLGLSGVPYGNALWPLLIGIVVTAGGWILLDRSQIGRRFDAAGADPLLAGVFGIRVAIIRFASILIGSVIAGFAGVSYAYSYGFVSPDAFGFELAIVATAYAVVGGTGHWAGPLIGGAVLGSLSTSIFNWGNWGQIITGALMAVAVIFFPDGLAGVLRKALRYRVLSGRLAIRPVASDVVAGERVTS